MTKKREFAVPLERMVEFAGTVSEWGLSCDIIGTGQSNEILVEVTSESYEEGKGIKVLKQLLEKDI